MASNVKDFLDLIKEIRGTTFNNDGTPKTGLWAEIKAWHTAVGVLKAATDVAAASGVASAATAVTQANTATTQAGISTTQAGVSTTQAVVATAQATNAGVSASTATSQAVIATTQASAAITQANNAIGSATTAAIKAAETVASATQAATSATNAAGSSAIATTKATEAVASALAAADSKNQASATVVTVAASASAAASSATSAGTSATTASAKAVEVSANTALSRKWANELEDVTINDGANPITYSAYHWARKAAASVAALANGVTTFLHLSDTPAGYGSGANRYVKVNTANNGLEFDTLTKDDVGLANVDNTSDANKPVSTPTQTALDSKQSLSGKDATGGYAGLTLFAHNMRNIANTVTSFLTNTTTAARTWTLPDKDGIVAMTNDLVAGSITNTPAGNIASVTVQAALNELDGEKASINSPTFTGTVNGIAKSMVGLGNADNTSDVNKPVSTAQAAAFPSNAEVVHSGYMQIQDQRASGTSGGASASGANNRTLNTVVTNTIAGASVAASVITLPAGTYRVNAESMCVADTAASHVTSYLQNTSDAVKTLIGGRAYAAVGTAANASVGGRFTIAATKTFTLVTQFTAVNTNGLGLAASFGYAEIYSNIEIWKE